MVNSLIEFHWNNALKTLTISERKGEFPGMLNKRKFEIVLVNENSGIGIETQAISKAIDYSGKKIEVSLKF